MPAAASLTDDFQDGVIDAALWHTVGTVTESGGRVIITPTASYSFLIADLTYSMVESQLVARIASVTPNGSTGSLESILAIQDASSNRTSIRKFGSEIQCVKVVSGVQTVVYSFPYNAALHVFWRMRESGGIFYWDVSATGASWTNLFNTTVATNLFPVNDVQIALYAGYTGIELFPGTFQIESVNPGLPLTASGASTSSGALAWVISTPNFITASGQSISTGTLAWTTITAGTLPIAAAGTSTSTGTLAFTVLPAAFTPGGTWFFEPPVAYDLPPTLPEPTRPRYLNAHARWKGGQRRGRSVIKEAPAGTYPSESLYPASDLYPSLEASPIYTIVDTPTVDQMAAALFTYQGGHIYEITVEEAYNLYRAGFTVYHDTDYLTTEDGDFIATESGDILTVEYSFGSS